MGMYVKLIFVKNITVHEPVVVTIVWESKLTDCKLLKYHCKILHAYMSCTPDSG